MDLFLVLIGVSIYLGLGILLVIFAYRSLARRKRTIPVRIVVTAVVAFAVWAIPFGDHTWGKLQFAWLCKKEEVGHSVLRKVSNVEGIQTESLFVSGGAFKDWGYSFAEVLRSDGSAIRYTLANNGKVVETKNAKPIAKYRFERTYDQLNPQIGRLEYAIVDLERSEKIATYISFSHAGGWLFRGWHRYGDGCPKEPVDIVKFVQDVLLARKPGR